MPNKIDELELRSSHVEEILAQSPQWMIKWGTILIAIVLCAIIMLSYLIKYPDIISANLTLTSENPPIDIMAKVNSKVYKFFFNENDTIEKEQIIAVLESQTNYSDVIRLKKFMSEFTLEKDLLLSDLKLDLTLQNNLQLFKESLLKYKIQIKLNPEIKQSIAVKNQLEQNNVLLQKQIEIEKLYQRELNISETDFNRSKELLVKKMISERDFEASEKQYLQIKSNHENLLATMIRTRITISDLTQQIIQLDISTEKNRI